MKKSIITLFAILVSTVSITYAQLEKGNVLVGGQLANIGFDLGSSNRFSLSVTPQVGYFIQDNVAIGGLVGLNYATQKDQGDVFDYAVGAFGRYYFSPGEQGIDNLLNHGRFFLEANAGLAGLNGAEVGFNIGFGPGYAYFITPNVALETSLKYNGVYGAGNSSGLGLNVGFQIHLPSGKLKQMKNNPSSL